MHGHDFEKAKRPHSMQSEHCMQRESLLLRVAILVSHVIRNTKTLIAWSCRVLASTSLHAVDRTENGRLSGRPLRNVSRYHILLFKARESFSCILLSSSQIRRLSGSRLKVYSPPSFTFSISFLSICLERSTADGGIIQVSKFQQG